MTFPRFGSYAPIDRKVTRPVWLIEVGDVVRYKSNSDEERIGVVTKTREMDPDGDVIGLTIGPVFRRLYPRKHGIEWIGHVDPGTWSLNPVYDAVRLEFQR